MKLKSGERFMLCCNMVFRLRMLLFKVNECVDFMRIGPRETIL